MPTIIEARCPVCTRISRIIVYKDDYDRWQAGEHVQNVWPEKSAIERETMISGVCSDKCWEELYGKDDGSNV